MELCLIAKALADFKPKSYFNVFAEWNCASLQKLQLCLKKIEIINRLIPSSCLATEVSGRRLRRQRLTSATTFA
jgi:hypothetical protein